MNRYYEALGLSLSATRKQARDHWHTLALLHHPDHGGDADLFGVLHAAYQRVDHYLRHCVDCNGVGRVIITRGISSASLPCKRCAATGEEPT